MARFSLSNTALCVFQDCLVFRKSDNEMEDKTKIMWGARKSSYANWFDGQTGGFFWQHTAHAYSRLQTSRPLSNRLRITNAPRDEFCWGTVDERIMSHFRE